MTSSRLVTGRAAKGYDVELGQRRPPLSPLCCSARGLAASSSGGKMGVVYRVLPNDTGIMLS